MNIPQKILFLGLLLLMQRIWALDEDAQCLKDFKNSIQDPWDSLSSWTFENGAFENGDACSNTGIFCLHQEVYSITLSSLGLAGSFPSGLGGCKSLTTLDLSDNSFEGPIPGDLDIMVPYLVTLNLSTNKIGGSIPQGLSNCTYLNKLLLNNNNLTGSIPFNIGYLNRLREFNVSHNKLSGQVPTSLTEPSVSGKNFSKGSFLGNSKLCGKVLNKSCSSSGNTILIVGCVVGTVLCLTILALVYIWFAPIKIQAHDKKSRHVLKTERLKVDLSTPVTMFDNRSLTVAHLMEATDNFSTDNITSFGLTGTVYKASFLDGTVVDVKMLRGSPKANQQLMRELTVLGQIGHFNVVPLKGYCVAKNLRFLIYKHMTNGTLKSNLRNSDVQERGKMNWKTRLNIGIGAAKGLAWIHRNGMASLHLDRRNVHGNICSANIFLDKNWEARIGDCGVACLVNPIHSRTDIINVGYIAPEYSRSLMATLKGDVYSFGIVLLELVSSLDPAVVELAEYVCSLCATGLEMDAVEECLKEEGAEEELKHFIRIACSAVQMFPQDRPSMHELLTQLKEIGSSNACTIEISAV